MTEDVLPLGVPYTMGAAFLAALKAAPSLAGITIHDNPVRAASLEDGARVVWIEDVSDGPAQEGQQVYREFRFTIGVINRTEASRLGVHTDYRAAKRVIDEALPSLAAVATVKFLREGDLTFRVENVDVGGGVIIASFTCGYRDPSFRGSR